MSCAQHLLLGRVDIFQRRGRDSCLEDEVAISIAPSQALIGLYCVWKVEWEGSADCEKASLYYEKKGKKYV